jgi:hypothetical protein
VKWLPSWIDEKNQDNPNVVYLDYIDSKLKVNKLFCSTGFFQEMHPMHPGKKKCHQLQLMAFQRDYFDYVDLLLVPLI